MLQISQRRAGGPVVFYLLALLAGVDSRACDVPVFRYALERWIPDPYQAFVFERAPSSQSANDLCDPLTSRSPAINLTIHRVDVSAPLDGPAAAV